MTSEETIQYLHENVFINPTPKKMDWRVFLSQKTDDELKATRIRQLDDADILTKDDLIHFVEIMEKYNPGSVRVVYQYHDPEVDLWERAGRVECSKNKFDGASTLYPKPFDKLRVNKSTCQTSFARPAYAG